MAVHGPCRIGSVPFPACDLSLTILMTAGLTNISAKQLNQAIKNESARAWALALSSVCAVTSG